MIKVLVVINLALAASVSGDLLIARMIELHESFIQHLEGGGIDVLDDPPEAIEKTFVITTEAGVQCLEGRRISFSHFVTESPDLLVILGPRLVQDLQRRQVRLRNLVF